MGYLCSDAIRILVRLSIGTITVNDVIGEEKEVSRLGEFEQLIHKYLEYLEEGICFDDLYFMMMYDYRIFSSKNGKQTDIKSYEDGIQKIKALYCANHIYNNRN